MKSLKTLVLLLSFICFNESNACNLSELNYISAVPSGPNYIITMEVRIGGGLTGVIKGGDSYTSTFGLGIFDTDPTSIIAFSPASLTSDTTMCTLNGANAGAALGADAFLAYISPGCEFTCVSTTAACGNVHTNSSIIQITLPALPDSITVFGLEGAGNPIAGCYLVNDNTINFAMILPVEWGDLRAEKVDETVELRWHTYYENRNNYFQIERSKNALDWDQIGTRNAVGFSTEIKNYGFVDDEPLNATSYYRIKQVDIDDKFTYSEIAAVDYGFNQIVSIGPNPSNSNLNISATQSLAGALCEIYDVKGQLVQQFSLTESKSNMIDITQLNRGMYVLKIQNFNYKQSYKFAKI